MWEFPCDLPTTVLSLADEPLGFSKSERIVKPIRTVFIAT